MALLTAFVDMLRHHIRRKFTAFDPMDGGGKAGMFGLFEKLRSITSALNQGSGFISRNNNDLSAQATFSFMGEADLPRKQTILWNVTPRWNGTCRVIAEEIQSSREHLVILLALSAQAEGIVLVGSNARRAEKI